VSLPILGIDLGTTNSAVARVVASGRSEVLANADGSLSTPSAVYFYDTDSAVVGAEAERMVAEEPEHVVVGSKAHLGDPDWSVEQWGKNWTATDIAGIILRKLKGDSETLLGYAVQEAVVAVPAHFTASQRQAIMEAGTVCGLQIRSVVNEPTAAAVAYGIRSDVNVRRFMVFDMGGGTTDITIMELQDQELNTLATHGVAGLGGNAFDARLREMVRRAFERQQGVDLHSHPVSRASLTERARSAKVSLSTRDHVAIPLSAFGKRDSVQVDRSSFEAECDELLDACKAACAEALEIAGMNWSDLDRVLLAGGGTNVPAVASTIKEASGLPVFRDDQPETLVARGAAMVAVLRHRPRHPSLYKAPPRRRRKVKEAAPPERPRTSGLQIGLADGGHLAPETPRVSDVATHTLGLLALEDGIEKVVPLIPKGTRLPYSFRARLELGYDSLTQVRVEVTEGTGVYRNDVTVVGAVELRHLPARPKGTPIEIVYRYAADQTLQVEVIDVLTRKSTHASLSFVGTRHPHDVAAAQAKARTLFVD